MKKYLKKIKLVLGILIIICGLLLVISLGYTSYDKQLLASIQNNYLGIKLDEITNKYDNSALLALQSQNSDLVGWLSISDTNINYPLMQTINSPQYYSRRNFDKRYSQAGLPYLDYRSSLDSSNLYIYAHNMSDGSMFNNLLNYQDEAYLMDHRYIELSTIKEKRLYEILAIKVVKLANSSDVPMEYLGVNFEDEQEFYNYLNSLKDNALYFDTSPLASDTALLTLSTCINNNANQRFIVVARLTSQIATSK